MNHNIERENMTVSMPLDLLELVDDLCSKKDLNRSQVVLRALKTYLAIDYARNGSLISTLSAELTESNLSNNKNNKNSHTGLRQEYERSKA